MKLVVHPTRVLLQTLARVPISLIRGRPARARDWWRLSWALYQLTEDDLGEFSVPLSEDWQVASR